MTDEIREALRLLEAPAEPPAGFADALFDVLVDEVGRREYPAAAERPRRARWRWSLPPRVGWAVAVVAVVALVVVTSLVTVSKPATAYAVVQEARQRFAHLQPFTAVTFRRVPGEMVGEDFNRHDLPDLEVVHRVQYGDDRHWRNSVVSSSYDAAAPPGFESFNGGERAGDYQVSDGTYIAHYLANDRRLKVRPLAEMPVTSRRQAATGDLDPGFYGFTIPAKLLRQGCKVVADATWIGRPARRLDCYRPDTHQLYSKMWLDKQTGLVLRLQAPGDDRGRPFRHPFVFEVRALTIGTRTSSAAFSTAAPAGATVVWEGSGPPPAAFATEVPSERVRTIPVMRSTLGVAADDRGAYVTGPPGGPNQDQRPWTLSFVDTATSQVGWTVSIREPAGVAVANGVVLVGGYHYKKGAADREFAFVDRFDAKTGRQLEPSIEVNDAAQGNGAIVSNGSDVWFTGGSGHPVVINGHRGTAPSLIRIDPVSGHAGATVPVDVGFVTAVSIDGGRVWVTGDALNGLTRDPAHPAMDLYGYDATSGSLTAHTRFQFQVQAFLVRQGVMWAIAATLDEHAPSVVRAVEVATGRDVASAEVGHSAVDIAEAAGSLWVSVQEDGTIVRIDPATATVVERIAAGDTPTRIAVRSRVLWVSSYRAGTVVRLAT